MLTAFLWFVAVAFAAAALHTMRDARRYTPAVQLRMWVLTGVYCAAALAFAGLALTAWRL